MLEITRPAEEPATLSRISYAQNMEDILLDRVFRGRIGTFVDIGANHPFIDSNTYFFYLRGWRGVNIEPNPRAVEPFRQFRPDDLNLAVAVSDVEGTLPFFEVTGPDGSTGLSTLERDVAETYRAEAGFEIVESSVPVRPMAALIAEHNIAAPDIVSIDVECHEAAVLRGIPLDTWRPKVLVVESTLPLSGTVSYRDWEADLLANGYLFATFNGVNRFYLRDDLADELHHFATPVSAIDQYLRHDLVSLQNQMEAYRDRYERARADLEFDRAKYEELKAAWQWGQVQAQHAQAVWENECASFARERETWKGALDHFERTQAEFERMQAEFGRQRGEFAAREAAWDAERAAMARDRATWLNEQADWEAQLADAQRLLRPYRLLDRLGVVTSGYVWARRLKRKHAS